MAIIHARDTAGAIIHRAVPAALAPEKMVGRRAPERHCELSEASVA